MEKEIKIPRAWIERLMDNAQRVNQAQGRARDELVIHLLGYIESAKFILEEN